MTPADKVKSALSNLLSQSSALRPRTAVEKILRVDPTLSRLAVQDALRELAPALLGVAEDGTVVGMVKWRVPREEQIPEDLQQWRDWIGVVDRKGALWNPPAAILELEESDRSILATLLRRPLSVSEGADHYIMSATNLMGSSKLLDYLGLQGQAEMSVSRPLFVITAGPSAPESVLIVENPSIFSALAFSEFCRSHLCISAFGYGLSIENIGERLAAGTVFACPAVGERVDLSALINKKKKNYWGDLDIEGLRIFEALQSAIPTIQLAAIYYEMERRLRERSTSHPYSRLFGAGKPKQRSPRGTLPEVRHLAQCCRERAVDQEAIWPITDFTLLASPYRLTSGRECSVQ